MVQFSSKKFSWKKDPSMEVCEGVAEASTLNLSVGVVLNTFSIKSDKTESVVEFTFDRTLSNGEEIMGWVYRPLTRNHLMVEVIVFND